MSDRIRDTIEGFYEAYMTERNLEHILAFVSEEIIALGTGKQERAKNKKEFQKLLEKEFQSVPEPVYYELKNYRETGKGKDWRCVYADMLTTIKDKISGESFSMETRLTLVCAREEGVWKILNLHMSVPAGFQEEEEVFPFRYGREAAKRMNRRANRELFKLMSDNFPGGVVGSYMEPGLPLYVINEEMLAYLGYTYEEMVRATGEMVVNIVALEDRKRVEYEVLQNLKEKEEYEVRYRLLKADGSKIWVYDKGKKIITDEGREAFISVVIDISDSIKRQEKLRKAAARDSLTGILNRREAARCISASFLQQPKGTLFVLDIDNFKNINDFYGHQSGDSVLKTLAGILKKDARPDDICARLGGDEFLVYFSGLDCMETAARRAELIQKQFRDFCKEHYGKANASVSIGISIRQSEENFQELYKRGDGALYRAKRREKGTYAFDGVSDD